MKIETDDWVTISEVGETTGFSKATLHRIAQRLKVAETIFGVRVVRKKDVPRIVKDKKRVGNPRWIESYEEASASSLRGVASRLKRIAERGMTEAELTRGAKIAAARIKNREAD